MGETLLRRSLFITDAWMRLFEHFARLDNTTVHSFGHPYLEKGILLEVYMAETDLFRYIEPMSITINHSKKTYSIKPYTSQKDKHAQLGKTTSSGTKPGFKLQNTYLSNTALEFINTMSTANITYRSHEVVKYIQYGLILKVMQYDKYPVQDYKKDIKSLNKVKMHGLVEKDAELLLEITSPKPKQVKINLGHVPEPWMFGVLQEIKVPFLTQ